ncbi:hypothetical protein FS749_009030 [Ceratobasidium sp. UAMH 11750]|nr:hypothetical protein FS749_009030 [Ceratobasidium sp. UAMH 11750]
MTHLIRHPASSSQVFAIPELATLICDQVHRADLVQLLRVSKLLFECVVPFVWRNFSGVAQIVALIPGTVVVQRAWNRRFYDPKALEIETTICLSKSLDLTRLRIYAPYIRTLEVSELPRKLYKVKGDWSVFNSTVKPGLLPNLHSLSITSTSEVATRDEINCLSLFLCSSLRSIRMKSWYSHRRLLMDVERFPTFLSEVARCCPLLETFEVYSAVGRPLNCQGITSLNYASPNDDAHAWPETRLNFVSSFQHVRHLSGSTAFLHPGVFYSIAKLPSLESLSLYDSAPGTQFTLTDIISVPDNAFPALRQLELRHLDTYITLYLCGLEPLATRLTSIVIEFSQRSRADARDFEDHDRSHSAICSLGNLAPHIANLTVYSSGPQARLLLDSTVIEALGRLPLQSLTLPEVLLAPNIQWKDVLGALSGVQVLRLRCTVKYHELEAFATCLPRLRVLELRMIEFMQSNHGGFGELGAVREVGVSVCLEGEVYIEGMKDDIMREAARCVPKTRKE